MMIIENEFAVPARITATRLENCLTPLRFVEREGEKILQAPWKNLTTHEITWRDVPLEKEIV